MATLARPVPSADDFPDAYATALSRGMWHPVFVRRNGGFARRSGRSASPGRPRRPGPAGQPPRRRLVRWLALNRRLAVTLLLCTAAGLTVQQLTPAPAFNVSALAAARDLPAGEILGPDDLTALNVPHALVPAGSYGSTGSLQGKQLAVALRKGQLLSDAQLLGPGLLAGSPPGSAAVPLRMADPASIRLLSPGQLVNVVMTNGNGFDQPAASEVLAAAVPVLWTSEHGSGGGQWLATGDTEGLLVVAVDAEQAGRLAGASTQGKLFFVLVAAAHG